MRQGGYERGPVGITVGKHPRRLSPCLFVRVGSVIYTVAYFRGEEEADRFSDALALIVGEEAAEAVLPDDFEFESEG